MCHFKQFNIRQHSSTPNFAARKHYSTLCKRKNNTTFALGHGTSSSSSSRQCRLFLAVEEAKVFTRRFMAGEITAVKWWEFIESLKLCEVVFWLGVWVKWCWCEMKNMSLLGGIEFRLKVWVPLYILFWCFDGGLRFLPRSKGPKWHEKQKSALEDDWALILVGGETWHQTKENSMRIISSRRDTNSRRTWWRMCSPIWLTSRA